LSVLQAAQSAMAFQLRCSSLFARKGAARSDYIRFGSRYAPRVRMEDSQNLDSCGFVYGSSLLLGRTEYVWPLSARTSSRPTKSCGNRSDIPLFARGTNANRGSGLCYAVHGLPISAGITPQRSSVRCQHNLGTLARLDSQASKRSTRSPPAVGILAHIQRRGSYSTDLRCGDPRCARGVSASTCVIAKVAEELMEGTEQPSS